MRPALTQPAMAVALPATQIITLLQRLPLFADVPEGELLSLTEDCRVDRFDIDGVIFRQGEPCDRIWLVYQGRVKIVRHEEDGREVILEIIPPGEVFGGGAIFLPEQPADARAATETEVVSFSKQVYSEFLVEHPRAALKLIRMLGARLHASIEMSSLTGERVDRRLAHILLKLAARTSRPDPEGTLITISLSRQDLADMCGTTLETAIRVMSRFRAEGLIKTRRGGYLLILDPDRLKQLAKT
ncbi:MAG TPA: Crp/Fnr family transcriptional regulator [Anaerolineae bacterium]